MLTKANVLLTGFPGCGKSTLVNTIINHTKKMGLQVGGISTPEFRVPDGRRGGFLIRDIASGVTQTMASVEISSPVRVGRYGVNLEAIRIIGIAALEQAIESANLIVIDEIGKMELTVPEFQQIVTNALNSPKPVLGTMGLRLRTPFITALKHRLDVTILTLTAENRNLIFEKVCKLLGI